MTDPGVFCIINNMRDGFRSDRAETGVKQRMSCFGICPDIHDPGKKGMSYAAAFRR